MLLSGKAQAEDVMSGRPCNLCPDCHVHDAVIFHHLVFQSCHLVLSGCYRYYLHVCQVMTRDVLGILTTGVGANIKII